MTAVGQPQEKKQAVSPRPDPEQGNLLGPAAMTNLLNRDPNKKYVFVSRNRMTVAEYRQMGYRPEVGSEGGVHVAGEEAEPGREIECMDHVLMSVSAERAAQIDSDGAFGAAGQKRVDAIEKAMLDKRAVIDHCRGQVNLNGRGGQAHFRIKPETSDLEEEAI